MNNKEIVEKILEITKEILGGEDETIRENITRGPLLLRECEYEHIKREKCVLLMGMNPARGTHFPDDCRQIGYIPIESENTLYRLLRKALNRECINEKGINEAQWFGKYMKPNYNLFENVKMWWVNYDRKSFDKTIYKLIDNSNLKKKDEVKKFYDELVKIETKKDCDVLYKTDLFLYRDPTQNYIEEKVKKYNKELFNNKIKQIINYNIELYNPSIIVITNSKVSNYVRNAIKDNSKIIDESYYIYNNIPFVFSKMVSGRNPITKEEKEKLKNKIKEIRNQ